MSQYRSLMINNSIKVRPNYGKIFWATQGQVFYLLKKCVINNYDKVELTLKCAYMTNESMTTSSGRMYAFYGTNKQIVGAYAGSTTYLLAPNYNWNAFGAGPLGIQYVDCLYKFTFDAKNGRYYAQGWTADNNYQLFDNNWGISISTQWEDIGDGRVDLGCGASQTSDLYFYLAGSKLEATKNDVKTVIFDGSTAIEGVDYENSMPQAKLYHEKVEIYMTGTLSTATVNGVSVPAASFSVNTETLDGVTVNKYSKIFTFLPGTEVTVVAIDNQGIPVSKVFTAVQDDMTITMKSIDERVIPDLSGYAPTDIETYDNVINGVTLRKPAAANYEMILSLQDTPYYSEYPRWQEASPTNAYGEMYLEDKRFKVHAYTVTFWCDGSETSRMASGWQVYGTNEDLDFSDANWTNKCTLLDTQTGQTANKGTKKAYIINTATDTWFKGIVFKMTERRGGGSSYISVGQLRFFGEKEYDGLKFIAEQANSTVSYVINGTLPDIDMKYSLDGKQWQTWAANSDITLTNIGDTMYVKGNNPNGLSIDSNRHMNFSMTGTIAAGGNVNSLLDDGDGSTITTIPKVRCFIRLFNNCTALTKAPRLPATILDSYCYNEMFARCYNMKKGPSILPAMETVNNCYTRMFDSCTSLEKAPQLPATTLGVACYAFMFVGCTILTHAPYLPATTLGNFCYQGMFSGCTALNYIKIGYTGNFSGDYSASWVQGVSSTGDFYYNGSDTTRGISAIPDGWTVHTF